MTLLLFDIDGTLLRGHGAREHARALIAALAETYEVALDDEAVRRAGPWGKTDRRIAREVLLEAGLDDHAIDARAGEWPERVCRRYDQADLADLAEAVAPGAREALEWADAEGHRLGLVTGNLEPVARRKLTAAGLGRWFAAGPGGFGSDAEVRAELVPLARERAGGAPRGDTLVIGDAPGDVECAQADGVRCVGVSSHFAPHELAGAVAVISELTELPAVVEGLCA